MSTATAGTGLAERFPFISGAVHESRLVVGISLVAALGGFLFGYDTGVIGGALLFITQEFNLSSGQQEAVVSSILVGAAVGALVSGFLADRIGRRRTKIISGCLYFAAALAAALAQGFYWLVAARFALGLSVGTASFVAPMYIAEMVPRKMRGGTVSFNQLLVTFGILLAYVADWGLKDVPGDWRWMVGIACIPGAALAIGMYFMPETPRWLVEHGQAEKAREVLRRIRHTDDVEGEMEEIHGVAGQEVSVRQLIRPGIKKLVIIGSAIAIFQQIVGINTVIYYSPTILRFTGMNTSSALTQALFVGLTNFVFTIVAVLLLDTLGRRFFLLFGTSCLGVALVALGFYFHMPFLQQHAPYMALACMLFYLMGFAIGLGPVFWLLISEIYPLRIRGPAMAVATFWNWAFNFAVAYNFLRLIGTIGRSGTFWFFAGLALCAVVFFLVFIPETKGRPLERIERDLGVHAEDVEVRG